MAGAAPDRMPGRSMPYTWAEARPRRCRRTISGILKEVRAVPLANDCEITVEGRLSNFGPDKMEACFEGGANRFSLGVQS